MPAQGRGGRMVILGAVAALAAHAAPRSADAAQPTPEAGSPTRPADTAVVWGGARAEYDAPVHRRGISCVPYARENSNIELTGNALTWWYHAAGVYARGSHPEIGSVLNFRATRRMRLGHVAVVTNIIDSRTVEIDHANWSARGRISRGVRVIDVSQDNSWSAVRVGLPASPDGFGSVYPTYGFIYDHPDERVMVAARSDGARTEVDEVAELPSGSSARGRHAHLAADARRHQERLPAASN